MSRIVVMPFRIALRVGNEDTSCEPAIPAGRGPHIKNATAHKISPERIVMIIDQNLELDSVIIFSSECCVGHDEYQKCGQVNNRSLKNLSGVYG